MGKDLSRRSFLTGTLAFGAATATAGALAGCSSGSSEESATAQTDSRSWDQETDVVVVGTGFAGLASAYTAAANGAEVLLIEKAPEKYAGGNSRVCAQAVWSPQDTDAAVAYFKEITGEYHMADIDDPTIQAYIAEAKNHSDWLLDEFDIETVFINAIEYPTAQTAASLGKENCLMPAGGLGEARIWNPMYEAVKNTSGITIQYETSLSDLVFDDEGSAIGIEALSGEATASIKAKKAVILCCGGFEFDDVLLAEYNRYPALAWGTPYNTGDGVKILMKYDIAYWHMNSATPATRLGTRVDWVDEDFKDCSLDCEIAGDFGYLWTDKYGARYMDETRAYQHGYGRDAMFYNDGAKMEWPRIPFWQIMDESTLPYMGTGASGWAGIVGGYAAADNIDKLLADGTMVTADTVEDLAAQMGVDPATLSATMDAYNAALAGTPDTFGRSAEKMRAFSGPLYAISLYPVMVNTNGGPRHNENANILRNDGTPIDRLYAAGEFGSIWAWYYQGAGNVSECMAVGRIAGNNAAALEPWDA